MWYIYKITNCINGKTYIGQHKYKQLNDSYMGSGKILKQAIAKYGIENFTKEIIVFNITSRTMADLIEKECIYFERTLRKAEYNITEGGEGFYSKHSQATKDKIRKSLIGNTRAKGKNLNNKNALGNKLTKETCLKMSKSRKGNANNGCAYIKCLETGEVYRTREWINKGYRNVQLVAKGDRKVCKNKHFSYIKL